mmetsp:Transcript_28194/g.50895  ORF Transcript_28194/g.50895 Transcript_28194/m.50895 type:complete len:206 (+) Transcript_28194:26-643(+)
MGNSPASAHSWLPMVLQVDGIPVRLAATVLFHVPTASKIRGSEPLDAYHTSVVIGEVEYSFGGDGVRATRPVMTHSALQKPTDVHDLGMTRIHPHSMLGFLPSFFEAGTYDLLCKNCNSFSDCVIYLLLGQRLEDRFKRLEKMARHGQKRFKLMSALKMIGMKYSANPKSQSFEVNHIIDLIDQVTGNQQDMSWQDERRCAACCC